MTELKDSVLKENDAVEVENVSIETSEQEFVALLTFKSLSSAINKKRPK